MSLFIEKLEAHSPAAFSEIVLLSTGISHVTNSMHTLIWVTDYNNVERLAYLWITEFSSISRDLTIYDNRYRLIDICLRTKALYIYHRLGNSNLLEFRSRIESLM